MARGSSSFLSPYLVLPFLMGTTLLGLLTPSVYGEKVDYSGYRIVSVVTEDEAQSDWLDQAVENLGLQLLSEVNLRSLPVDILVPPEKFSLFYGQVHDQGLQVEVNNEDVQMQLDNESSSLRPPMRTGAFDHGTYHDLDSINAIINSVESDFPERVSTSVIGTTYEKRPIRLVQVTSGSNINTTRRGMTRKKNKDIIFFDCGIHAREWVSPATCLWILDKLLFTYGQDKTVTNLLDKYDFYIIPVVNPDGYVYSRTKNRFWRKNRKPFGSLLNCIGVDPNRNFEFKFGTKGTNPYPCSDAYPGPKAFSEEETKAYRDIILKLKDRLKLVVTIHAYSQLWMTPYGYDVIKSKHYDEHMRVSKIAVEAIEKVYGTKFKYGPINTIIYPVGGSSVDWVYEKVGIPMSFALELRDLGRYGFLLPSSEIIPTAKETWAGLAALIEAMN
ncbi:unnamed protein product [Meganyctiphanes norvegica]|uniref:Peptidase M14 domain-containing protein n=1 Tax=Meganyctiphanes norvegica TaxID=48144 RepID=A0AAV2PJH7_MEGNR